MSDKRQKNQLELAFPTEPGGEASRTARAGTESLAAKGIAERPASMLMEEVCKRENLKKALQRVKANKGSAGIDGMSVEALTPYLQAHWPKIREQLLTGTYQPQPVKRVEIEKSGGGVRQLGIPTVVDRFIEQAVLQVLQPRWDPTFSDSSFGFRPGRSAHQAVAKAQQYIAQGYRYVVDIDLARFFDRVCHDKLMGLVAKRVSDKRMLKLIRAFLTSGVLEGGLCKATEAGVPQGGPLSPLLSNLMLDVLDRELERRGHRFCRYADDCNIYVRSWRAGERVMESISGFITDKLRLKVNAAKSAVARPWHRQFLGFSFTSGQQPRRRLAPKTLKRFKARVRALTRRNRGISLEMMVAELARYLKGWLSYYGFCQTPTVLERLDKWIKRRLRCYVWRQWKSGHRRYVQLRKHDVNRVLAAQTAGSNHGPWYLSTCSALHYALPNAYFNALGLPTLAVHKNA
jgi:RNA-directed DNA polymerase